MNKTNRTWKLTPKECKKTSGINFWFHKNYINILFKPTNSSWNGFLVIVNLWKFKIWYQKMQELYISLALKPLALKPKKYLLLILLENNIFIVSQVMGLSFSCMECRIHCHSPVIWHSPLCLGLRLGPTWYWIEPCFESGSKKYRQQNLRKLLIYLITED